MTEEQKESPLTASKVGNLVKTWLPIAITVGTMIVGYFVFKADTQYRFELQQRENDTLRTQIQQVREDISENRREWQTATDTRLTELERSNLRNLIRIKLLEGRPIDEDD